MACKCNICSREDRGEIENAILNMTSATNPEERASLSDIAGQFGINVKTPEGRDSFNELKMHALFHMPLVTRRDIDPEAKADETIEALGAHFEPGAVIQSVAEGAMARGGDGRVYEGRMSLAQKMKLHEADMLTTINHEYLVTLKAVGRRINRLAATSANPGEDDDAAMRASRMITKPMTELYLGLGAEIRKNVATLTEVDRALNGPQDQGATGLAALAAAIRSSGNVDRED